MVSYPLLTTQRSTYNEKPKNYIFRYDVDGVPTGVELAWHDRFYDGSQAAFRHVKGSPLFTAVLFQRTVPLSESAPCYKDSVCSSVSPWLGFPLQ